MCIAEHGCGLCGDNGLNYTPCGDVCVNVRRFMVFMLDALEATAASRKEFSAAEWLQ